MNQAKIVIRDIHRYGDDLTMAEAVARLQDGYPVTVTDPAPPGGDPRGNPCHGSDITITPAGGAFSASAPGEGGERSRAVTDLSGIQPSAGETWAGVIPGC